jgi:hypothetical protein
MNRLRIVYNHKISTICNRYVTTKKKVPVFNDVIDPKKTIIKKSLIPRHKIPLDDLVFGITIIIY